MVEEALQKRLAEMPPDAPGLGACSEEMPVDPDASDPETGRAPPHVIAEWDAKRQAGLAAKAAEKATQA